ncbi:MAG: Sulfate/thiosulfate import ATP-binding protein CysA [Candidatus Dichloromethanomonas elyunquensis]|nr:MAG: Sulfate/thiosulfate import ATP-binding protein CysA [Candidatus Dichloromethanomonas elyunquensis]
MTTEIHEGIRVKDVSKSFGGQTVLKGVNLDAARGSKTVIVGSSGAGKSTLLRIIAGLELPDGGEIYLGGKLASSNQWMLEPRRRDVGFVFQNPTLWPHMTVLENILFGLARLPRKEAEQLAVELLQQARIGQIADKYPDQISGGEAKRVSLVRSIAPRPRYLMVDEPFANLDNATKQILLGFLMDRVAAFGMTLIYVTHSSEEVEIVGETVVRIESPDTA